MDELRDVLRLMHLALKGKLPLEVFLRESQSIPGLRFLLLLVRWATFFGIGLRFWVRVYPLPEQRWQLDILWSVSIFYLLYTVVVTALELMKPDIRQSRSYLSVQILADVVCFSTFYYLAGTEESALFLFYLLPIFVAIEHFNFRSLAPVVAFILVCFIGVLYFLSPTLAHLFSYVFPRVFLPRALFLGFTGMVGLFLRQTERVQKRTLMTVLDTMGNGISIVNRDMRLLWINEFERKLVPAARIGEKCHQAFHGQDMVCQGCSVERAFQTGDVSKCLVCHRVHGEDRIYELTSGPIRDQRGRTIAVLSVVSDVSERVREAGRLAILHHISSLVRAAEIDKPERLEEVLWRILAGVVAEDGIGFERAILVLEQDGLLRGKLGIGPLNTEDAQKQWAQWERTKLSWTYEQIGDMRGDSRLLSGRLNQHVSQLAFSDDLSRTLHRALEEDGEPRAKVVRKEFQGDPMSQVLFAELPDELELDAFAIAPLVVRGELIGILLADDVITRRPLREDSTDVESLQHFADQAAIAVETARALTRAQLRLAELEALYQTSLEISAKQWDIQELLRTIVQRAAELLDSHLGSIFLTIPGENKVQIAFTYNLDQLLGITLRFGEGMAGRVAESGEPLIQNDYHNWPGRASVFSQEPYRDLFKAVVQVPLMWQGEVIGVLDISDVAEAREFDQEDIRLLKRFATAAAVAIGNARLYSYLQTLVTSSPDAIIAVDRTGLITQFNEASEQITGFRREQVIEQSVVDLYYGGIEEARRIHRILIESEEQRKRTRDVRTAVRGSQAESIPIRFAGAILRDELGEEIGSIGLMTDLREIGILDREYKMQRDFLAQLEHHPQDTPINNLADLQERLTRLAEMTCTFCGLDYAILFASAREDETVLQAVAWAGLPPYVEDQLPHFNWRKAGLQPSGENREDTLRREAELITKWRPDEEWGQRMASGIRGYNADFFTRASCGVPLRLADNYRGVLVFSPFAGGPDLLSMEDFIRNIAQTITISALSWLQTLYLRTRHKESQTSAQLVVHRARMYLTQIVGKFGLIKKGTEEGGDSWQSAGEGERLGQHLSRVVARVLTSRFAEMEPGDFEFQNYPLSALVQNCVESFMERAESEGRELVLAPRVEYLPYAEVDPAILSIALGNLIENALKYSFEATCIPVFTEYDTRQVTITVQDLGEQMPQQARGNLIQPGKRWAMSARARRIPGMGFGLWEASVIVAAHGGTLNFTSSYQKQYRGKRGHLVRVWMTLPLRRQ